MACMSIEDKTRQNTVYITDSRNCVQGSGVLFYSGGDKIFVFTCAHVVDAIDTARLYFLKPVDIKRDLYQVFVTEVPKQQILCSSLYKTTDEKGMETYWDDVAIIQVQKPENFVIDPTDYFIGETSRNSLIYTQGYPNGVPEGADPIEYLECLHGSVVLNIADSSRFTIRITDSFLDASNRVYELKGLSGAAVWDGEDKSESHSKSLLGLVSAAYDSTALLSKVFAVKSQQIRTLMNERFGIMIQRRLVDIPDEDVAGSDHVHIPVLFDGVVNEQTLMSEHETWIEEKTSACRCYIDDLKLQKAIDTAKEAIDDPRFASCRKDGQKKLMQHLLYCYEIGDLDEEFEALEKDMQARGLLKKYDALRHLTRSFMKREYDQTIAVADSCLENDKDNKILVSCAHVFRLLARAYTEDLPVGETIGRLLDDQEDLVYDTDGEDKALLYQMIGYVYGEKYHDYVNAVRFLNRSYRIGNDQVVLESLGASYYFLSIHDARREDDTVDLRKIDRRALYKARECFLIIIGKADERYWSGTIRRVGLCIYNTFVFLNDNYRILTIYPDIKRYITAPDKEDNDKFWRDIEMKYARIAAQSGAVNTGDYPHIKSADRILLETIAVTSQCGQLLERTVAQWNPAQIKSAGVEERLKETIKETENNIRRIEKRERTPIYIQLMNLYGRGIRLFIWKKVDKLKYCFDRIQDCGDPELLEVMENFIYEFEAPIDDVIQRFKDTFHKKNNITAWQELNHLYIRHGMLDMADAMYRELMTERKELIAEEPEYAYRAYMDYITMYRRDMKDALQCYLDAKETFADTDIAGFWELELMTYTNTFNDPERFEIERRPFMEKGLVTEEQFHRAAFIAYLANLNEEKTREHYEYISQYPHPVNPETHMAVTPMEEIHFLNWIGAVSPKFAPPPKSMTGQRVNEIIKLYKGETWHQTMDKPFRNKFNIDKKIAVDAWGLYVLAETTGLDIFKKFDRVYASHATVIRLLQELSRTGNAKIRAVLDLIKTDARFKIVSAGFKTQIEIRTKANYWEAAAAVAIGIEKECSVILGEPEIESRLIDKFKNSIVRVNEVSGLFGG